MQIHVARAGKELGVFSPEEVRNRLASGEFLASDHGWAAGHGDWKLLSAFPELAPPPKPLPPPPEPVRDLPPRPDPVANVRKPKKKPGNEPSELGLAPATTLPIEVKTESTPVVEEKAVTLPAAIEPQAPDVAPIVPVKIGPVPSIAVTTPLAEPTPAKPAEAEPSSKPQIIYFEPEKPAGDELLEPDKSDDAEISEPEPSMVAPAAAIPEPEPERSPEPAWTETRRTVAPEERPEPEPEPEEEAVFRVTLESKPKRPETTPELEPTVPRAAYEPTIPGEAVASMVLGLLSISFLPILAALPAVSLGHVAKRRIENSHGMLRGEGLAFTGLVTGYIGSAVALVALLWAIAQAFIGFVETRETQTTSLTHGRQIAAACRMFAVDHSGKFPETLEKLIPNYLPDSQALSCPLSDPSEMIGYYYYGGTDSEVQGKVLLISKGHTTRKRRVVVYADATTALLKVPAEATAQEAP